MADTIPGNTGSTQVLAMDDSATSDIDTLGDSDWWRVSLQRGFGYQISVQGASDGNGTLVDPLLRIFNASGAQLAFNDNTSTTDVDAYVEFMPTVNGTYFVSAEASPGAGIGSYTISIYRDALGDRSSAAVVSSDGQYWEDLGYRGDVADWVAVTLQAGVQYVFDLVGIDFDGEPAGLTLTDPWLGLRNSLGTLLTEDDSSGIGENARIVFTPSVTGTYFLDAEGFTDNDYGSYVLNANRAPGASALAVGATVTGTLLHDGDLLWHPMSLFADRSYRLTAIGSGTGALADPLIELLYADGTVYDYDDDSGPGTAAQLAFTPPSSGQWWAAVRSSGHEGTGSYTLQLQAVPRLSIGDATLVEGDAGTAELVFSISLSVAPDAPLSITVATNDTGNATAGVDFVARSESLTFAVGQTSLGFRVAVLGDTRAESLEAVGVRVDTQGAVVLGDAYAVGLIIDNDTTLPTTDPLLPYQWYLGAEHGVNVLPVWSQYRGSGVRVVVFDQGIDSTNPDLQPNLSVLQSRNAADLGPGGLPQRSADNHGTAVAGVIAAAADNGGLVGVAPKATLVSVYSPLVLDDAFAGSAAQALIYARGFDVLNNSWGTGNLLLSGTNYAFYDDFAQPRWAAAAAALQALADQGRNGLGTVVVQSAGNAFDVGDDTNLHNFQNSRYIITVGATGIDGTAASYSSTGASILVAAPGGDGSEDYGQILSTDRSGVAGYASGSTAAVSGTSFSSPIVAGVVALMLQANPRLGYRDVQEILARSARLTDEAGNDWAFNGARDVNGGGQHFDSLSHDLGFGLVDARAAVRIAETWGSASRTSANVAEVSVTRQPQMDIPDDGLNRQLGGAVDTVRVTQDLRVERAEVTLHVTHPWVGDLYVLLTSPAGTSSFLVSRPAQGALSAFGSSQNDIHFTLDSVLNWGESAVGDWSLGVFDVQAGLTGRFDAWTLHLIGQPASEDSVYTFTDEFVDLAARQPQRAVLTDVAGLDTLNAAAVSSDVRLDLSGATGSRIGTQALTLASGTQIERAVGGDGNDTLIGNGAFNVLHGGRGSDTLDGGAGLDIATFAGLVPVDADLARGTALQGSDSDSLIAIEALFGSSAGDTLRGLSGDDSQRGEWFRGLAGNDTIDGGSGVDTAEYLGLRASYSIVRADSGPLAVTVTDNAGTEGVDSTRSVERFIFADQLVAFGTRAEELARVAFVLWTPAIVASASLFSRGLSYYDVGYDFNTMCATALQFHTEQGQAFAQKLVGNMPGTSRTVDGILALMNSAGGGDAGRAAAVAAMALDDHTTQALAARGVFVNGVVAELSVPGFGTLFSLLQGP